MNDQLLKSLSQQVRKVKASPAWLKESFPAQIAFIQDSSKFKVGFCSRRAGKSYGCGLLLCKEAFESPGASILYVGLTRESAERIILKDILRRINATFGLGAEFNKNDRTMVFPNGAVIYIEGADSHAAAMNRFRGQKLRLAVIDEAAEFRIDVHHLLFKVLKPALSDLEGAMIMIGTPSDLINSYFMRVVTGRVKGWSVHRWTALENPHMKRQFAADMAGERDRNPNVDRESWFRQEYLGEPIVNADALVYRYDPQLVNITDIPAVPLTYALGITLTYTKRAAFSVVAYSDLSRSAYVVETLSYEDDSLSRVVATVEALQRKYDIAHMVCAEAGGRLVEELRLRHGLSVREAPEKDKEALIRVFTDELAKGHVKVLADENKDLLSEWDSVIFDNRGNVRREHPLAVNQLATATLYAWQCCYNYAFQPAAETEPLQAYVEALEERINARKQAPINPLFGRPY